MSQLSYIVYSIRKSRSRKTITHGIFIDASAAFDKVWHNGMFAKLGHIGVEDSFFDTIRPYFAIYNLYGHDGGLQLLCVRQARG